MMKYGLSDRQLDEIISMIREHEEVEEAILFGSRAMGTFKRASDVDIALKGDRVTNGLAAALQADFEEDTYLPLTTNSVSNHVDPISSPGQPYGRRYFQSFSGRFFRGVTH